MINPENKIEVLEETIRRLKLDLNKYKYDNLTGFLMRHDFFERIECFYHEFETFNTEFIVSMIDIDGLHNVNREFGMEAGDQLIRNVSNSLIENFKEANIFRIGGDEMFIIQRGNNIKKFNSSLSKIENSTCASILVSKESQEKYGFEDSNCLIKIVDTIVTEKKSSKCRRETDVVKNEN